MAEIKRAKRSAAYVKIGMMGISGSGKTMSALLMGKGLISAAHPELTEAQIWDKILVIDTENSSASLYAGIQVLNTRIGEFLTIDLHAPFTVEKYIDAIQEAENAGVEFLIIDSLSHAWNAEGGLLDQQNAAVARSRSGNSYQAWKEITPKYNRLIEKILQCNMHVVATYRGKKEYALEQDANGKMKPVAKGMGAQFRDGMDYESTVYFEINQDHMAYTTKDRTHLFDGQYFMISEDTGRQIYSWLASADHTAPQIVHAQVPAQPVAQAPAPAPAEDQLAYARSMVDQVIAAYTATATPEDQAAIPERIKAICGRKNYNAVTDIDKLRALYAEFAPKAQ